MINYSSPGQALYWARFTPTATQSVNSGSQTKMLFQAYTHSDNWPAVTFPTGDITIPVTGLWLIIPHDLDWGDASNGAGSRRLGMRIGDVSGTIKQGNIGAPTLAAAAIQTVQGWGTMRPLTANNTIQMYGFQSSGGALNAAINDLGLYLLAPLATNPLADTDN